MKKIDFTALSADGIHTLAGVVYLPEGEAKGIFHIVHGMTEHIGRYDTLMRDLAEAGYIACGYDNLGHGRTARDKSELGYIAKRNGWEYLVRDVAVFSSAVRECCGRSLPYYLMGHSMGSFIARLAAARQTDIQGLIVMGTGGPNPAAGAGLALIALNKRLFGDKHISPFIEKVAFGGYNKSFSDTEAPNPWLTTDLSVRERYKDDPYCRFKFTVSAMGDLIRLTKNANAASWYKSMPKNLPVLLVSGKNDVVGDFGKGVLTVKKHLEKAGVPVTCRLYEGARHEILNDFTYESVKKDILAFLSTDTKGDTAHA